MYYVLDTSLKYSKNVFERRDVKSWSQESRKQTRKFASQKRKYREKFVAAEYKFVELYKILGVH